MVCHARLSLDVCPVLAYLFLFVLQCFLKHTMQCAQAREEVPLDFGSGEFSGKYYAVPQEEAG